MGAPVPDLAEIPGSEARGEAQTERPPGRTSGPRGSGSTQALAILPSMGQTGAHPFAQNLALELRKHRQQSGHGPTGGCSQVQRFGQRDETDAQMLQLLQRAEQDR